MSYGSGRLDNLYALRAADVKWIFSVEEDRNGGYQPCSRRNGKEATERGFPEITVLGKDNTSEDRR